MGPGEYATGNKEVGMSRSVVFGKDLGLMAQVMLTGLSVGVGKHQLWEPLSEDKPGLWDEVRKFLATPSLMEIRGWRSPEAASKDHCVEPEVRCLDQAVRNGRTHKIGKREWTMLAENSALFRALVDYLVLSPPFSVKVPVDYLSSPVYRSGSGEFFPSITERGWTVRELEMCIHTHHHTSAVPIGVVEKEVEEQGWRFADQSELHAFGLHTQHNARPWALCSKVDVSGLGTLGTQEYKWQYWPIICANRTLHELEAGGTATKQGVPYVDIGEHLLIVRN